MPTPAELDALLEPDESALAKRVFGLDGPANGESGRSAVAISDDGRTLVYETYATNLVEGDTVDQAEVVAWRR